jgi:hypothetical protein
MNLLAFFAETQKALNESTIRTYALIASKKYKTYKPSLKKEKPVHIR